MKKLAIILSAVLMLSLLAACGEEADTQDLQATVEEAVEEIESVAEEMPKVDIDSILSETDPEKLLDMISDAKDKLDSDQFNDLKDKCGKTVSGMLEDYLTSGDYDKAGDLYEKAAKVVDPEALHNAAENMLKSWSADVLDSADMDKLNATIDKIKETDPDIDYDAIKSKAEEALAEREKENEVLAKAYDILSSGEYERIGEVDGTDAARELFDTMTGDHVIYAPEGARDNFTGKGSGMYKTKTGGYYFFYGDYVDGIRSGEGVSGWVTGDAGEFEIFEGHFENDAPNGHGIDRLYWDQEDPIEIEGNYTDGLQDGEFTWNNHKDFTNSWTAVKGEAQMIDVEPYKSGPNSWAYTDYMKKEIDKGWIIYTAGFDNANELIYFLSYNPEDYYLGAVGFCDK